MKALILGAGAVGSVVAHYLSKDKGFDEVICGDINLPRAKEFINFKSPKVSLVKVDATNKESLLHSAKDVDLIINTALPRFNKSVLEAALASGANYQDLCSHLDKNNVPEQFSFSKRFEKEKLVALINTGMSPGITNAMAKDASQYFDNIDYIKIRTLQHQISTQPIFALSPEIILEESTEPAVVYRNEKFAKVAQFSEFEDYEFAPGNSRFVYSVYGDEVATLPRYIKTRNVDFRAGGNDIESAKAMFELGLLSKDPVKVGNAEVVPLDFVSGGLVDVPTPKKMLQLINQGIFKESETVMSVELLGKKFGKNLSVRETVEFHRTKEINSVFPGANYISFPTGLSAYCFSSCFRNPSEFGVFSPEALSLSNIQRVLIDLTSNGLTIQKRFSSK